MVAELLDRSQVEMIRLALEYAPQPPFQAGTPEAAPPAVITAVRERMATMHAPREAIISGLEGTVAV